MKELISQLIQQALTALINENILPADLAVTIQIDNTKDKTHGDFASNIAMMLAKPAKMKPRDLAEKIVAALPSSDEISKVEIAGPGFLNFFQNTEALANRLDQALTDPKLLVTKVGKKQRVVIDLSSPNLAKEMHVGHLRSTIIGDAVARVAEFLGDTVIRQNHVGDWGTQFGMLLAYMEENPADAESELSDLENFYRAAKKHFDASPEFATKAREMVVKLQAGDKKCLELWTKFNDISLGHCQQVYDRLDVKLTRADVRGESAYNDDLPKVIAALKANNMLTESDGAQCIFLDGFKNKEGEPLGMIVQKADGGYLYTTTDLAAIRYRNDILKADRCLYFVDQRQSLHFDMLYVAARQAGFANPELDLEHMGFGTMNGEDGKPFKTRDGGVVKLIDLLNDAEQKAYNLAKQLNPEISEEECKLIAHSIGIGAVKYADLSKHRTSDYTFSFDNMLSLVGNTAPYLLYAYTRTNGVLRTANKTIEQLTGKIVLEAEQEKDLAAHLMLFSETLNSVASKGLPHLLCSYLYDLAKLFSTFYEECPVLKAANEQQQQSRLRLTALTGRTLKQGLELLGLVPLERM
ncbi:arginine--tRNA ligase [Entomomonas asaccharolytica]|uniref:Arginine--tRNA ligase n=1 Tax=Entomomonas asaccharolytica TaxID=2785331 RepID=A0A974NER7_9GAMM|nr:arginine--tRNA ligase [Entomomonas asaccharolytica]QQP85270.1 arginine--tRNA ligase [Entomomonas asaccharolytica]